MWSIDIWLPIAIGMTIDMGIKITIFLNEHGCDRDIGGNLANLIEEFNVETRYSSFEYCIQS